MEDSMFEDNKIFILGLARSGSEAAKYLIKRGNVVVLNDAKEEDKHDANVVSELRELGVNLVFGSHPDDLLDKSFDYLIKNPGVPIDHKYVLKARELGIPVINEAEMTYRLLPDGVKIVGITGTNGKTTTTTLIYNILKEAFGDKVYLSGNIGIPNTSLLNKVKDGDIIVQEVSVQQLENMSTYKPNIGVMTNLSLAHIDFMKSYKYYKDVKTRLFINQTKDDIAIINYNDEEVLEQVKNIKSTKVYFGVGKDINCYLDNDIIYYNNDEIIKRSDIFVAGLHNVYNVMAAICVAKQFNISNNIIREVVSSFRGVTHRLEYVDNINGRVFYNDTEATNIKCTQIALDSFNKPTLVILGGLDRGQDFNELKDHLNNVKMILAIGQSRDRVVQFAESMNIPVISYEYLKDGFKELYNNSSEGDVILLSPASASWDQYKECEIRGSEFKRLVEELK
jgi:UDP-N-acetylmuramoyl-L-alanine--D-glutamate ligase